MANFMKAKVPKPIKKPVIKSDVVKEEKLKIAEEEISKEEKISEPQIADEKTGRLEGETEEERIDRQVTEVLGEAPEEVPEETVEEPVEETPAEEPEPEPEPEEEKPKAKKKTSRKKKENKPTEKKENKEPLSIDEAQDLMLEDIMPCTENWNAEKERVAGLLDKLVITEELNPTDIKVLLADMSSTLRDLIMKAQESKTAYSNLKDTVEEVKVQNSVGANSEERKLNSIHAIKNYEKDGQIVDLTALLKFYRERAEFYEAAIKQIEINRQMLITFGSVFKIELAKAY